jgi:hypothetical protein
MPKYLSTEISIFPVIQVMILENLIGSHKDKHNKRLEKMCLSNNSVRDAVYDYKHVDGLGWIDM